MMVARILSPAVCIAVVICRTVMVSGCYRLLAAGSVNALRVACCCTLYSLARRPRTPSREQQSSTQGFRRVLSGLNISSILTAGTNSATALPLRLRVPAFRKTKNVFLFGTLQHRQLSGCTRWFQM